MPCALAQDRRLPHTPCPTPPESASVRPATPGLRPSLLPRASGRWPARSAPPTRKAKPPTANRGGGSADWFPHVPPVAALLLAPGVHPPHAARPPFHTEGRNPAGSMPHHGACGGRWPSQHSCRLLPTPLPGHSAYTTAKKPTHAKARGLTSLQRLLPLRGPPAPLPTAARLERYSPGQCESHRRLTSEEGSGQVRRLAA